MPEIKKPQNYEYESSQSALHYSRIGQSYASKWLTALITYAINYSVLIGHY